MDLSIVIVTMNNWKFLKSCLDSLFSANLESTFDIVVVDNGSSDDTPTILGLNYPSIQVIKNDRNVGLSQACNQGINASIGKYVLFLNDDTLVKPGGFDIMVKFLDSHPKAGAIGGRLVNPDGSFQSSYCKFPTLFSEFLSASRLYIPFNPQHPSERDVQQVCQVDWITSACLMVRRAALDQVGLLDEVYFIYGDEVDLQYRMKQCGWQVFYLPQVETIHYGGRSLNRWKRRHLVTRGKIIFFDKNYGSLATLVLRAMFYNLSLMKLIVWEILGWVTKDKDRARQERSSNIEVLRLCTHYKRVPLDLS